jgi:hypothetical protein
MAISDRITSSLNKIKDSLAGLPREAYNVFKGVTPKRSGNARNKTVLKGDVIHAGYAYATKLNRGSSSQAPTGMVKPTEQFIKERLKTILRK